MDSFKINIQYSDKDLQEAYKIHYTKIYPLGSRLLLIIGVIALFFGVALFTYSYFSLSFTNWFALFLVAYGIVVILFFYWRFATMGKRIFKKMPDFKNPYEYTFSEKGIKSVNANVNSENRWEYYIRSVVTDNIIMLYPNKLKFNFFSRRHFTNEQFLCLKNWVNKNVSATAKL